MEFGSASHEKAELVARGWCWLKALPDSFKTKVVEIAKKTKKLAKDDPRRVIHSLKMGLALTLVSLFYYFRPLYKGFEISDMWAVVLEFTVGATLWKGINRGFATFLAGALGAGAQHLASLAGERGEPILLGLFVFLLVSASTFSRFFPGIKARYYYGVLIFVLTFSLVAVSGFRVDEIIEMAYQRLSTILIGSATCVIVSIFICPVWAGEDLHNQIALNMDRLGRFLEGFGGEYFKIIEDGGNAAITKDDKSILQGYESVLNTKASEESLANFARWEPCHGRFKFRHPWKQYLKIGTLARQCAYKLDALNGYINSEIQAPPEFQRIIQEACSKMSLESGKALKALASAIKTMTQPSSVDHHVTNSKTAANNIKSVLKTALLEDTDLLQIIPVMSLLIEVVICTEKIAESVHELSRLAQFKTADPSIAPEKPQLLHREIIKPLPAADITDAPHVSITVYESSPGLPENGNPAAHTTGKRMEVYINVTNI